LLGYFLISISSLLFLEKIIYPVPQVGYSDSTEDIIKLTTNNNVLISAKYVKNPNSDLVVLYSHGNGEDIASAMDLVTEIYELGFSVLIYDYAGYGTSEGKPGVSQTKLDIEAAYQYLISVEKIPAKNIIIYGRSIGGGPSVHLASKNKVGGLVLESTFASIYRSQFPYVVLPFDKYPNIEHIDQVEAPVLIFHGTKDTTIKYWNAKMLYTAAKEPKKLITVEGAGHNNLLVTADDIYSESLLEFKKSVLEEMN